MREYAELIPEPGFGPLAFDLFPYQEAWYSEEIANAEEVVFMKSTQVGQSAWGWRWAVRRCDQFGDRTLYIFPTDTHVTDFGDERIEPAIQESPYLRSRILGKFVKNKHLKRIGRGFLYLRGSNSKAGAQSVAAQSLVFDEYDLLDQTNLPQIERRITGAKQIGRHPRIRRIGTPTLDDFGIAAAYADSDKREWHVKCRKCKLEQTLTWEESVRWRNTPRGKVMKPGHDEYTDPNHVAEAWRGCRDCGTRLDVARGRWIVGVPGRSVIGFHATRLIVPNTDLVQIVKASRKRKPQEIQTFENNDLGRPYSPASSSLDVAAIIAACSRGRKMINGYAGPYPVTMGVDVAGERNLNVRISEQLPPEHDGIANPRRALWVGEASSFNEVVKLMDAFGVAMCAIDANPERRSAKTLRATFPGRVVMVEYDYRDESEALKIMDQGEAGTALEGVPLRVKVNRTEAFDAMIESVRQVRNMPPLEPPYGYVDQMRSPKRRTVIGTNGRPRREYVATGTQGDDYAHAEVYDLVATELLRMRLGIQSAQTAEHQMDDEEMGFRRVRLAGDNPAIDDYRPGFGEGRVS